MRTHALYSLRIERPGETIESIRRMRGSEPPVGPGNNKIDIVICVMENILLMYCVIGEAT